jgi:hypothetical protein
MRLRMKMKTSNPRRAGPRATMTKELRRWHHLLSRLKE